VAGIGCRIKLAYLEALEDGRVGDLPGVAYATAFLRQLRPAFWGLIGRSIPQIQA